MGKNLNLICICSPDKISMVSFIRHIKKNHFTNFVTGEMHSLMSEDSVNLYLEDFCNKFPNGIISYYAKGKVKVDPLKVLPKKIFEKADFVIWFDLFSTEPKVLKSAGDHLKGALMDWKKLIEKLNQ